MTDWNGWEPYAPDGVWPLRSTMHDEFAYQWFDENNNWRRVAMSGKEWAQRGQKHLTEGEARERWEQENTAGCAVCGTRDFVTGTGEQRLCYSCWQTHGEENTPALEPHRDSLTMFKVGVTGADRI